MMDRAALLEQIRSLIRETFHRYGAAADSPVHEAMLIRNGFFCGRRFMSDGFHAVWFVEENEIKFYGRDGGILEVLALDPQALAPRAAA